ncbi:hypothetical protein RN001_005075 [Aquatica leii]|uniref:Serpin domain-containing protein n=1 Tax=Aquatica leii TaxID=1421715 RepID=A0AAN7PFI3_9COLE|nr:hypothetical protein RN001_005075 [Aquatica leii]
MSSIVSVKVIGVTVAVLTKQYGGATVINKVDNFSRLLPKSGNFLICPISLESLLALIQVGSTGETAKQISVGLKLPISTQRLLDTYLALHPLEKTDEHYQLKTFRKLFFNDAFHLSSTYKDETVKYFHVDIQNLKLLPAPKALRSFDEWLNKCTESSMQNDFLSTTALTKETRAIFGNIVSLKGVWVSGFQKNPTLKRNFFIDAHHYVEIEMLDIVSKFNYYQNEKIRAKFLELTYENSDSSLNVVLPYDINGLSNVETSIQTIIRETNYRQTIVNVRVPKMELKTVIPFNNILQQLGIKKAFQDNADLSLISDTNEDKLKIDGVMQETYIKMEEKEDTSDNLCVLILEGCNADLSDNIRHYQEGNLQFSIDVFKKLVKTEPGNALICPLSADIALAMSLMGARGETQRQLAAGTHLPPHPNKLKATFAEVIPKLESSDKYTFELANKIYVQNTFKIHQEYRQNVVNHFKADIENINFKQKDNAVLTVNKWVSEKTHNTIQGIIEPKHLNDDTRLLLLNAIYFKGQWIKGFKIENTKQHPFYVDQSHYVNTDMMTTKGSFRYYEDVENKVRLLEMPYKGDDVTMTIVLPDDPEGLPAVANNIEKIIVDPSRFFSRTVNLGIPKFKITSSVRFTDILKSLGVILPFEDGANFDGMIDESQNEPLKIDEVLQKAAIEVDEQGTVASAITAVSMQTWKSAKMFRDVYFYADHPFIFYIRHKVAGVTFIGKYVKPSGSVQNGKYPLPQSHTYNQVYAY